MYSKKKTNNIDKVNDNHTKCHSCQTKARGQGE